MPPERFGELASDCRAEAVATGDSRFSPLADMFDGLAVWWEQNDAVPTVLARSVEQSLAHGLPSVLNAPDPKQGAVLAEALRQTVAGYQLPQQEWFKRGYVSSPAS